MLRLAALVLVALSAWVGAASAAQPAEPLALEIEHSRPRCTSGTLTEVSWSIRGGVPPYALSINGEAVDPGASSARVPCGSAVDDALEWLLDIGNERYITATATDAAGEAATAHAQVVLVAGRQPPVDIRLASEFSLRDTRRVTAEWRSGHREPWRSRSYLVRWRVQGTMTWAYENVSFTSSLRDREAKWTLEASQSSQIFEFQFADLRHPLELETPEALIWSTPQTVTIAPRAAPPRNLTATATHDSISLSWGPDVPGLPYTAGLLYDNDRLTVVSDGALPYAAHFDDLLPNTWYTVGVGLGGGYGLGFEVRTEPAPPGWSRRLREPRNLEARLVDGGLQVTWEAPLEGAERDYRVCLETVGLMEHGTTIDSRCGSTPAGERRYTFSDASTGGTYRLRVTHASIPEVVVERTVYVSYPAADIPTGAQQAPEPLVSHRGWAHAYDAWWSWGGPDSSAFLISWPTDIAADLAEIEWEIEGEKLFRQTPDRETMLYIDASDSIPFRIRYLQDGVWMRWSEAVLPSLIPSRPPYVHLDEHAGNLMIRWRESIRSDVLAGYRVYVSRDDGEEDVLDVGRALSAAYPIDPEGTEYSVSVAAYNEHGEESRRREAASPYQPGASLTAQFSFGDDRCVRSAVGEVEIEWSVRGGAGPFFVAIDDAPPFEADSRVGTARIPCQEGDGGGEAEASEQVVSLRVTDYHAQTASDSRMVRYAEHELHHAAVQRAPYLGSVHDTYVWLAWRCRDWWFWEPDLEDTLVRPLPDTAAVRWRSASGGDWRYAAGDDFPQESYPDRQCRGRLEGLEPSTRYEFQIARYERSGQLSSPELLAWTESATATTTGPATGVRVALHPEGLEISWRPQPDAWAYQVVARAGDTSWWTFQEQSGELIERAILRGATASADLFVEVITPPQTEGGDRLQPFFIMVDWPSSE